MKLDLKFKENAQKLDLRFGQYQDLTDGGYERGFAEGETVGYAKGYSDGETKGIEQGKKSEHDTFWDIFQANGKRRNYEAAFKGGFFNRDNFKPKYDIIIEGYASGMGAFWGLNSGKEPLDLAEHCNALGIRIDFSTCEHAYEAFREARVSRIGELDLSSATYMDYMFYNATALKTIDKIISSETTNWVPNIFLETGGSLTHCIFEGIIAKNFNIFDTNLDKESLVSVINTLSPSTSGLSCTLRKKSIDKAFETSTGSLDGSKSDEWSALVATKSNWTIALQ